MCSSQHMRASLGKHACNDVLLGNRTHSMSASHILHRSRPHAYVLKALRVRIPSLCLHACVELRACAAAQGLTWGAEGDEALKLAVARWTIAMVYALQAHLRQGYDLQAALQVRGVLRDPTLPSAEPGVACSPSGRHRPSSKLALGLHRCSLRQACASGVACEP